MAYLQAQNLPNTVAAFRKAIELDPKHGGAQLKLAELMAASRNKELIQDAATRIEGILAETPDNPEALYTLALAEFQLGHPEDARAALRLRCGSSPPICNRQLPWRD